MTIQRVNNALLYGLSTDTKPTSYPTNTLWVEHDTNRIFRYTGSAWTDYLTFERAGKAVASGNGSTTVFNIAHGIGANPSFAMAECSSLVTTFTYTTDATNIVVTFTTAPTSGSNNVIIYWRAVS